MLKNLPKKSDDWPKIDYLGVDFREDLHIMLTVVLEKDLVEAFATASTNKPTLIRPGHIIEVLQDPRVIDCEHSGGSERVALNCISFIAKNGWEAFCSTFSSKDRPQMGPSA